MAQLDIQEAARNLPQLIERAESGEEIVITRDGNPAARLALVEPSSGGGARFLAVHGSLAGQISIGGNFEFTDDETDEMLHE